MRPMKKGIYQWSIVIDVSSTEVSYIWEHKKSRKKKVDKLPYSREKFERECHNGRSIDEGKEAVMFLDGDIKNCILVIWQ